MAIVIVVGRLNPLANGKSGELKGIKLLSEMAAGVSLEQSHNLGTGTVS